MKIIGVSACLLGKRCKYNGTDNYNTDVADYCEGQCVVPICPEVLGGLTVPREPCEIVHGSVRTKAGRSCDLEYYRGAEAALKIIRDAGADCLILQPRSPSCGVKQVYDGTFTGRLINGKGIFAQMAYDAGIPVFEPEDLEKREMQLNQ